MLRTWKRLHRVCFLVVSIIQEVVHWEDANLWIDDNDEHDDIISIVQEVLMTSPPLPFHCPPWWPPQPSWRMAKITSVINSDHGQIFWSNHEAVNQTLSIIPCLSVINLIFIAFSLSDTPPLLALPPQYYWETTTWSTILIWPLEWTSAWHKWKIARLRLILLAFEETITPVLGHNANLHKSQSQTLMHAMY